MERTKIMGIITLSLLGLLLIPAVAVLWSAQEGPVTADSVKTGYVFELIFGLLLLISIVVYGVFIYSDMRSAETITYVALLLTGLLAIFVIVYSSIMINMVNNPNTLSTSDAKAAVR